MLFAGAISQIHAFISIALQADQVVSGLARFSEGEEVVLFLERQGSSRFQVTGLSQGKFRVERSTDGRDAFAVPERGDAVLAPAPGRPGALTPPVAATEPEEPPFTLPEGDLPPLEDRLPEEPLVVVPYDAIGKYGGRISGASIGPEAGNSEWLSVRHVNLLRFADDLQTIVPNMAKAFEWNSDYTELTVTLRKGHKWSDGQPFTSEDIDFWWNDIVMNKDLYPETPSFWVYGGQPMQVQAVDPVTVKFKTVPLMVKAAPMTLRTVPVAKGTPAAQPMMPPPPPPPPATWFSRYSIVACTLEPLAPTQRSRAAIASLAFACSSECSTSGSDRLLAGVGLVKLSNPPG